MTLQAETKNMAVYCDFENIALGARDARFAQFDIDQVSDPIRVNGSQPLIPPRPAGAAAQPTTASQPALTVPGARLPVRERPRWRTAPAARYRRGVVRP